MDTKLWYYTENYGTLRITKKKSMVDYQKLRNFDLQWKKAMEIYQKYIFLALELRFTMENLWC